MLRNPGVRTIEEELLNALFKAELITEDDKACLGKVHVHVGIGAVSIFRAWKKTWKTACPWEKYLLNNACNGQVFIGC